MSLEVEIRTPTLEEKATASKWPLWDKEESEFEMTYAQTELCLILKGEVDIVSPNKTSSFKAGDYVIFPKGFNCKWIVKKHFEKHYKFI